MRTPSTIFHLFTGQKSKQLEVVCFVFSCLFLPLLTNETITVFISCYSLLIKLNPQTPEPEINLMQYALTWHTEQASYFFVYERVRTSFSLFIELAP